MKVLATFTILLVCCQVTSLFTNFTWTKEDLNVEEAEIVRHWVTPQTDVFVSLIGFTIFTVSGSMGQRIMCANGSINNDMSFSMMSKYSTPCH